LTFASQDHSGQFNDYIELCKLYDKNENGTMMLAELENILANLGKSVLN
jgi:Ca2+-binding EF-hand superfamily protein